MNDRLKELGLHMHVRITDDGLEVVESRGFGKIKKDPRNRQMCGNCGNYNDCSGDRCGSCGAFLDNRQNPISVKEMRRGKTFAEELRDMGNESTA